MVWRRSASQGGKGRASWAFIVAIMSMAQSEPFLMGLVVKNDTFLIRTFPNVFSNPNDTCRVF